MATVGFKGLSNEFITRERPGKDIRCAEVEAYGSGVLRTVGEVWECLLVVFLEILGMPVERGPCDPLGPEIHPHERVS